MPSIPDTDDTVLTLDEAVMKALFERHDVFRRSDGEPWEAWHLKGNFLAQPDEPSLTLIALVIDTLKTLVREVPGCETAYCMTFYPGFLVKDAGVLGGLSDRIRPTELQAWLVAYNAVKRRS